MFALRSFAIVGGSPALESQVRAALAPELGRSLLAVSGAAVDAVAARLPDVVSLRFARSFPHTLKVIVTPERAVLLVRRGAAGFVVSARGRVMSETRTPLTSPLPRLWVARGTPLSVGERLGRSDGLLAAAAAAALRPGIVAGGVRFVTVAAGLITMLTPSGFQVRLGDVGELRLKLAIAERIVAYARSGDRERRLHRRERPAAARRRLSQLSSRKYRLRLIRVETAVFRIDKRNRCPYSADGRALRSVPACSTA